MDSKLPIEIELIYEVMPCNAMRSVQEPLPGPHACSYFRQWGTYHSFDYVADRVPVDQNIPLHVKYVGRANLLPEVLSGCRKSPIMAIGINPNLPGWFKNKRGALNPMFDSYKQYAHYFRYRSTYKLLISQQDYTNFGGGIHDTPFSGFTLNVPADVNGDRVITAVPDDQTMYEGYLGLLKDMATAMAWPLDNLKLEEDFTYMNMIACPSARWRTTTDPTDPLLPPMTVTQRDGIVNECFRERKHFIKQLYQSLPAVIIVFSQSTATPFITELHGRFTQGDPRPNESVDELSQRHIRLHYGNLDDGSILDARVIFSPHISGDPDHFNALRARVLDHLIDEARSGRVNFNPNTGHLARSRGGCSFCPALEIGPCPYSDELRPLAVDLGFASNLLAPIDMIAEKRAQQTLIANLNLTEIGNNVQWIDEPEGIKKV